MKIDARNQTVSLSVGEFSRFSLVAAHSTSAPNSILRAQAGQIWHNKIQSELSFDGEQTDWINEKSISGTLEWMSWKIKLTGRIDQFSDENETLSIREIKTTTKQLPLSEYEIETEHTEHLLQLLAYRELFLKKKEHQAKTYHLELLYIALGSGQRQSFNVPLKTESLLATQLTKLCEYLEAKRERLLALRFLQYRPAYETPRPGQETVQDDLQAAFLKSKYTCLVAPTGYGKTGVAWESALKKLANGDVDRIIYLTSKTTGQIEATNRLQALIGDSDRVSYWNVRNKLEHCINHEFRCSPQTCSYLHDLKPKWDTKGLQRLYLFSNDSMDIEEIREEGRRETICPYELMRAGIGFRDIWVGDYNYLFSPQASKLFTEQNDFDSQRTFLIIDEAHNLNDRVRSI